MFLAGGLLEPVAAALPLAAQIDDGAHTQAGHGPDVVRGGLRGAPGAVTEPVPVEVGQAEDAMVDQQHVEVGADRAQQAARPHR